MTPGAHRPSAAFLIALAILIALGHAVLALTAKVDASATADELGHITAGLAYNTRDDFRLQPENGNLPQRWAALPATLAGAALPPTTAPEWRTANVWGYSRTLFYGPGAPGDELLFRGRAMIALFSAATGVLIFLWSRALFGWRGAFVSLLLFALCPAFLAHGALTTSDVVMTFFFLAAVGAWWRQLERPGLASMALSAVTFGLACVAKASAVLLLPMFALITIVWLIERARAGGISGPLRRVAWSTGAHVIAAWAIIWLFYGFRFSPFAPAFAEGAGYNRTWDWLVEDLGWQRGIILAVRDAHLLPDAFLYGFTHVIQFMKQRAAFYNGEHSFTGWVSFFPYAFLVKTTPGLLLALVAVVVAAAQGWRTRLAGETWPKLRPFLPLAVLFGVYWLTSLASHLNIGHRHILPTYPVLFIAAGALGAWLDRQRPLAAAALVGVLALHAFESGRIRPHYLAYFNALAGGPENGWRRLVDSSLDWGQDLPGLRQWLDRQAGRERVFLSYLGAGDPAHEGIRATLLPMVPEPTAPRPWHALAPGIYAVSATMLQQVYSPIRGPWTLALEKEFQELRPLEPLFAEYQTNAARRAALLRDAPVEKWTAGWKRYEQLRFARLCHFLRVKQPETSIGYSIRVYRLNAAELAAATASTIQDWQRAIEQAAGERR